jgi:hypothetical protein
MISDKTSPYKETTADLMGEAQVCRKAILKVIGCFA